MNICWNFPYLESGPDCGLNDAGITTFKEMKPMESLAREICQNSLDARRSDLPEDEPVRVKFELTKVKRADYDLFEGYEEAVDGAIEYWADNEMKSPETDSFLAGIKSMLAQDEIPVLVMRDYGTTGLTGVGPAEGAAPHWRALVGAEGVSVKTEESSAGSFGIGKNAPFAYSTLRMVFYSTYAVDGGRALQGVTHLITTLRDEDGERARASETGNYLVRHGKREWRPIGPDSGCPLMEADFFARDEGEYGSDVAIFGFNEGQCEDWERRLAIALIKNFVLAIKDGKLEAVVASPRYTYVINEGTLERFLFSEFSDADELRYAARIYQTVQPEYAKTLTIADEGDLTIYVRYDESWGRSVSRFRSTGMLIWTNTREGRRCFTVVVEVNDVGNRTLSRAMRAAEPPTHNKWNPDRIDDKNLKRKVQGYIKRISKEYWNIIESLSGVNVDETMMDAGVGSFLPDSTRRSDSGSEIDELKVKSRVESIKPREARTSNSDRIHRVGSSGGKEAGADSAHQRKPRPRKREKGGTRIPSAGRERRKGFTPKKGSVRTVTPNVIDHRTFLCSGNRYKLHVVVDRDYENVFVQYSAGREDGSEEDVLKVASYEQEGMARIERKTDSIGPISLKKGGNNLYIEFTDKEILAVMPKFTMEVKDGE